MKTKKRRLLLPLAALLILAVLAGFYLAGPRLIPTGLFGFPYEVPAAKRTCRNQATFMAVPRSAAAPPVTVAVE